MPKGKTEIKPRNKFDEMREDATRRIIDASIELFAEYGYAATTMQMIAKRAGVVPSGIYHYYSGKDVLLNAVVNELSRDLTDWVMECSAGIEIDLVFLDRFFSYCINTAKESRTNIRLLLRLLLQQDDIPQVYVKKMMDVVQLVKNQLPQYAKTADDARELEEICEDLFAAITMYTISGAEETFSRQADDLKKRFLLLAQKGAESM